MPKKLCPILMATRVNRLQSCKQEECQWWIKNRKGCALEFLCCIENIGGQ